MRSTGVLRTVSISDSWSPRSATLVVSFAMARPNIRRAAKKTKRNMASLSDMTLLLHAIRGTGAPGTAAQASLPGVNER